mgnify:CR=1 FL=1|tara:strand:+ start:1234 stop:1464 length:231 start_codon:yes stop_codon:yes gene_type:complete
MENLYEQLLPDVKFELKKNKGKYKNAVKQVIAKLHVYHNYSQMSMDDIKTLITFSDTNCYEWTASDWKYGEKLFKQ